MPCLLITTPLPRDCNFNVSGIKEINLYPAVGYSFVSSVEVSVTELPIAVLDFLKEGTSITVDQQQTPNGLDKTATFTLVVPRPTAPKEEWVLNLLLSRQFYLQYTDNNDQDWIMIDAQCKSSVLSNPDNQYTITIVSKYHYAFIPPTELAKAYLNVAYTEGYS